MELVSHQATRSLLLLPPSGLSRYTCKPTVLPPIAAACLASVALADGEACSEMIDFGVIYPLLELVRSGDPIREVRASEKKKKHTK